MSLLPQKKAGSSSNHQFSGVNSLLVSERVDGDDSSLCQKKYVYCQNQLFWPTWEPFPHCAGNPLGIKQKTPFREKNWWMKEMKQEYVYVVKHMNILHIHNSYE